MQTFEISVSSMGGANRLDGRLEAIEALLATISATVNGADLGGLTAMVTESGRFLEERLAGMEHKLDLCYERISHCSMAPKLVNSSSDAGVQVAQQADIIDAACQADEKFYQDASCQENFIEDQPEWAGGEDHLTSDDPASVVSSVAGKDEDGGLKLIAMSAASSGGDAANAGQSSAPGTLSDTPTVSSTSISEVTGLLQLLNAHLAPDTIRADLNHAIGVFHAGEVPGQTPEYITRFIQEIPKMDCFSSRHPDAQVCPNDGEIVPWWIISDFMKHEGSWSRMPHIHMLIERCGGYNANLRRAFMQAFFSHVPWTTAKKHISRSNWNELQELDMAQLVSSAQSYSQEWDNNGAYRWTWH